MDAAQWLDDVRREYARLRNLAESALGQVDDAAFFFTPSPESNSLAVIVKHLAGNMRSRWRDFLTSDGEKADRNRDGEFEQLPADTRESLEAAWRSGWGTLESALNPLTADDLERTVTIRGEPHSVAQAIQRQLSHYAYHVGQIVFLSRLGAGEAWRSLSIPKGGSRQFNADPRSYLKGRLSPK